MLNRNRFYPTALFIFIFLIPVLTAAQPKTVEVSGKKSWTDTGIDLRMGQVVKINASGSVWANNSVECPPDGVKKQSWVKYSVIKDANHEALIGKVGRSGEPFLIGSQNSFTSKNSGRLYLGVNDKDLGNNKGAFKAFIKTGGVRKELNAVKTLNKRIKVSGKKSWTNTGINLNKGMSVSISASGTVWANRSVECSPDGVKKQSWVKYSVIKNANHEALIAKIGKSGEPFLIGSRKSFTPGKSGILYLGVNDKDLQNNKGFFNAVIKTGKSSGR